MVRKIDRIARVVLLLAVGLQAIIPGWQIMTDGSVYGFKLPAEWLTGSWPFEGYFVAGLVLFLVIGVGCTVAAVVDATSRKAGPVAALVMGLIVTGWIAGELLFMTQTMVMTWFILACGLLLIALAAPYALPRPARRVGGQTS